MTTETALAIRPVQLVQSKAPLPTPGEMSMIQQAAALAFSGAVTLPKELNTPQKVAAVMLYGWELGLKPMTSIRHLYIVNGRVAPSSEVMAGLVMAAEPDCRLLVEELTDTSCTMRIQRPSRMLSETYTVTWDEIKKAGLARDNNLAYPRDRLRYHCTKRLLRIYAPDLINSVDGPSIESLAPTTALADGMYNDGDEPIEGSLVEAPPVQVQTAERLTNGQVKAVSAAWGKASDKVRAEARKRWPKAFPEPAAGAMNNLAALSKDDADDALMLLSKQEAKSGPAEEHEHEWAFNEATTLMVCSCGATQEEPPSSDEAPVAASLGI